MAPRFRDRQARRKSSAASININLPHYVQGMKVDPKTVDLRDLAQMIEVEARELFLKELPHCPATPMMLVQVMDDGRVSMKVVPENMIVGVVVELLDPKPPRYAYMLLYNPGFKKQHMYCFCYQPILVSTNNGFSA